MRKPSKLLYSENGSIQIENWLHNVADARPQTKLHLLREAIILAQYAGEGHVTPNGESCIHQGLAMAEILIELNLDDASLVAGIVYSSLMYADLSVDDITEHLGPVVAKLVNGTRKMDAIHDLHGKLTHQTHLANTVDNLRKMMLAIVDDVRVVIIKLAERLCILRNMLLFNEDEKKRIAQETMDIYAPLANRLGIGHLKWPLEDLSFRYLNPEEYHTISKALKSRRSDRDLYVERIINKLKTTMMESGIDQLEVTGRAKHIYSIYRKMQRKNVAVEKIYDAIAFRILVPTIEDCYTAISVVHGLWKHIPEEFDDYIVKPKPNGYRSIHTAVEGPEGKFIEVQIRTFDMHQDAELGVAAHWVYKEGPQAAAGYEAKIAWLRQVMDWQKEVTASEDDKEIFSHAFEDRIYVFTPNGDVIDLPRGATPLDFAYSIHSEIGHNCRGAKVNGVIVPLNSQLHSSEKVEILTTSRGHPSRDWLNPHLGYLKTPRAKAKVLNWFRRQDHDKNLAEGHDLLDKELRRLGIKELSFDDLATKMNFKNKEDMFVALGRGDLRTHQVVHVIQSMRDTVPSAKITPTVTEVIRPQQTISAEPTDIVIEGVKNLLTHLAGCCKPIPGDAIMGYITLGKGVSIHRKDCEKLINQLLPNNERILEVSWGKKTHKRYPVDLHITAQERHDLIRDISGLLANDHIPIIGLHVISNRKDQTTFIRLTIEVDSVEPLSKIITHLNQLPHVIEVRRD